LEIVELDEAEFEMSLSVIRHFLGFQAAKLAIETIFGGACFSVGDQSEMMDAERGVG